MKKIKRMKLLRKNNNIENFFFKKKKKSKRYLNNYKNSKRIDFLKKIKITYCLSLKKIYIIRNKYINYDLESLLKRRIDIFLVKIQYFCTIFCSRQNISHRKVFVNDKICKYSSKILKKGDKISFKNSKKIFIFNDF
ncbi:S4 domain-containing protein [Candidatus Vidania fulgoroideorum]